MISVVIPCYNCADSVSRAIESVFRQDFENWELILVNNNSVDETGQVLRSYEALMPERIKVYDELTKGAAAARNRGLKEASGEWIQLLDADDEILPGKFTRQLELAKEINADLVIGSYERELPGNRWEKIQPTETNKWLALIKGNLGITSANLWKAGLLKTTGGFKVDQTSSQEYELMFRLLKLSAKIARDLVCSAMIYAPASSITRVANGAAQQRVAENWIALRHEIRCYLIDENIYSKEIAQVFDKHMMTMLAWYQRNTSFKFVSSIAKKYYIKTNFSWKLRQLKRQFKSSI